MAGEVPAAAVEAAAAAARAHARAGSGEDAVWRDAAAAAIAVAESFLGQVLVARDVEERVARGGVWRLLAGVPATAITGADALAADGTPAPLTPDGWTADLDAEGRGWVRVPGVGRARVRYRAGAAADWGAVPAPVRQGVAMLAAHLTGERGAAAPPAAVAALWRPFRRMRLDERRQGAGA